MLFSYIYSKQTKLNINLYMNYNDYPILDDNTYTFLKEQFNKTISYERNTTVAQIYNTLIECKNLCYGTNKFLNKKIQNCIEESNVEIDKILNNLSTIFKNPSTVKNNIQTFNLFSLLKKLTTCLSLTLTWHKNEEKVYYKNLAFSCQENIIKIIFNFLNILEKNNIILFKYM